MSDCRDTLTRSIDYIISQSDISQEEMAGLRNKIIAELSKYEVSEKSMELATLDTASEALIQLFVGTCKVEGKSMATIRAYAWALKKFKNEIRVPLSEVNTFEIRAWLLEKQNTVSLRTCENYRSYLSSFYTWASNEGILRSNSMAKIKPVKYEEVKRKSFTDVELDALRSNCSSLRERAELEVFLSCGARASELCQMDIGDINLDTREVIIRHGKGNKQRVTYVNDVCIYHLRKYLETRKDDNPAMFMTKRGNRVCKSVIEHDIKRIGGRAGVNNTHPHRCRRTFATSMAKRGMDVIAIQALMGHNNLNTTQRYIALSDSFVKNEYERFA